MAKIKKMTPFFIFYFTKFQKFMQFRDSEAAPRNYSHNAVVLKMFVKSKFCSYFTPKIYKMTIVTL